MVCGEGGGNSNVVGNNDCDNGRCGMTSVSYDGSNDCCLSLRGERLCFRDLEDLSEGDRCLDFGSDNDVRVSATVGTAVSGAGVGERSVSSCSTFHDSFSSASLGRSACKSF